MWIFPVQFANGESPHYHCFGLWAMVELGLNELSCISGGVTQRPNGRSCTDISILRKKKHPLHDKWTTWISPDMYEVIFGPFGRRKRI